MIVLHVSKKSDYINSKTYWFTALLALKSIKIKKLSNITEIYCMLFNVQMRVRCKWFMIYDFIIKFTGKSETVKLSTLCSC